MKQNILLSAGIATIIIVFVLTNILVSNAILIHFPELSMGITAFYSYGASAVLTIIYTLAIKKTCDITVPSLRPEISKVNPRLIVLGFIMILAMNIFLGPLQDLLPNEYMEMMDRYMNNGLWAMVVAVIIAPIFEEFIFRGVVQENLIRQYGPILGITLGAAIFGIMHIIPQQAVNAAGVGLIIGSIYYMTGSLNTVVAIHFINNGFAYLLFLMFSNTNQIEDVLLSNKTIYVIAYAISVIILILGVAYVIKYTKNRKVVK